MEPDTLPTTHLFAGKYKIVKKIGRGSYASVYMGIDKCTREKVAIKLESIEKTETTLQHEGVIYTNLENSDKVPKILYFGQEHGYNLIVMDLLGPSLRKLHYISTKFSLSTVLQLANQILVILENIHNHSIIHRDLKPDNFLIGRGDNSKNIYIIDFGLAIKYNNTELDSGEHHFVGNAYFASCNAHENCQSAPRDDLESLGYILVYFLHGTLPWCSIDAKSFHERVTKAGEIKLSTTIEELCDGLPEEFSTYLKYCRGLKLTDVPNYEYVRQLFDQVARRMNVSYDNVFDWTKQKQS
ncbi:Casein kinase Ialpha [Carabus blaptoides fortunei]